MTDMFTDVPVPDSLPRDEGIGPGAELTCEDCGTPLEYSGRGRKPKKCPEHRKNGSKSGTSTVRKTNAANTKLAEQAADALALINSMIGAAVAMPFVGLEATAEAINVSNPTFRDMAAEALIADPKLARQILTAGGVSGKMALLMAYGMFGMAVAPVAYMELKARQEVKASGDIQARAESDGAANAA